MRTRPCVSSSIFVSKWSNSLQPVRSCLAPVCQILRAEGIECLTGELLLVKLQNASVEALHGNVRILQCSIHSGEIRL